MNSKQRVYAALRKEDVDRVPIYMWFHPGTTAKLANYLEIDSCWIDSVMGNDVKQTWINNNHAMEGIVPSLDSRGSISSASVL